MQRHRLSEDAQLLLYQGDLTRDEADAIVNAANPALLGGGGVDGAIHRAAGPELLEACRQLPEREGVRCPTGEARITPGFRLRARHVIHTVGPIYDAVPEPARLLAAAHASSLALANEHALASVAFPAISCGVYGYPLEEAAAVALAAVREHRGRVGEVRFALYGEATYAAFCDASRALLGAPLS